MPSPLLPPHGPAQEDYETFSVAAAPFPTMSGDQPGAQRPCCPRNLFSQSEGLGHTVALGKPKAGEDSLKACLA